MSLPNTLVVPEHIVVNDFFYGDEEVRFQILTSLIKFDCSLFQIGHINSFRRDRYDLHDLCVKRVNMCLNSLTQDNEDVKVDDHVYGWFGLDQ